jgi:hypothetical protein
MLGVGLLWGRFRPRTREGLTRRQARKLIDELLESEDRLVLLLLTEVMAKLSQAGYSFTG